MPLTLNCPKCHKPFRVRDESVGMKVKCPTCGAVLQVPANLAPASTGAAQKTPAGQPAPTKTAKAGGGPTDSLLDELPTDSASGPPSLPTAPTQPIKRRQDEDDDDRDRDRNRGRAGRAATTGPLPPSRKPAKAAAKSKAEPESDPEQIVEDAEGWRRVRKGIGWVQIGLALALIPAIGHFAMAAYALNEFNEIPARVKNPPKGLFGLRGMNLFSEMFYLYAYALPVLPFLFVLFGRVGCMSVPGSAKTRGLAGGTLFLTFLSFAAFATFAACHLLPALGGPSLPRDAREVSWTVLIYFGLLAEAWFVLFLAQAGFALSSTRVLSELALSILLLMVMIAGVLIANDYYAVLMWSSKLTSEKEVETYLIHSGVYLVVSVVFVFRIMSVAGIVRRAINRWLEDNKETLQAVPE